MWDKPRSGKNPNRWSGRTRVLEHAVPSARSNDIVNKVSDRLVRRYTNLSFPPYRHRPGVTPHPRFHPEGHLYTEIESLVKPFNPSEWTAFQDYLYGVDLYNAGYYWEAHEAWEGLWKTTDRTDTAGLFLQGLIQVSAALLKKTQDRSRGMRSLSRAGKGRLLRVFEAHRVYCGIDLGDFLQRLERIEQDDVGHSEYLKIRLQGTGFFRSRSQSLGDR